MRIITLEEHFATPGFLDGPGQDLKNAALKFEGRAQRLIEGLTDIADKRMAAMDAAGVDMQVLVADLARHRAIGRRRGDRARPRSQRFRRRRR